MSNLEAPKIPTSGIPFRVMNLDLYDRNFSRKGSGESSRFSSSIFKDSQR